MDSHTVELIKSTNSDLMSVSSEDYDPQHIQEELYADSSQDESISRTKSNKSCKSNRIARTNSNVSELSRILSGIRDDQHLDHEYSEPAQVPEEILNEQLNRASQHTTRIDLTEDLQEEEEPKEALNEYEMPETFYSWIIALSAMLCVFSTWGTNASFGVFLLYSKGSDNKLSPTTTFPQASEMDYALIGGLVVFLAQFLAPLTVLAYKVFGHYRVGFVGIVIQAAGYILASFSKKVWHLYLTQGFMVGVSFSMIFLPATLLISTWFNKHAATAMGITVAGAGVGGVFFSLVLNKIIEVSGDQRWALRTCGIVTSFTSVVAILLMKPRSGKYPPLSDTCSKTYIVDNLKVIFDRHALNTYPLVALALWFGVALLGYILLLYTMAAYCRSVGLSAKQASTITAIMNAAQTVGRPFIGFVADYFGRNSTAAILCLFICIMLLGFWINATNYHTLIALNVIIGIPVGVGSTFCQSMATELLDRKERLPGTWSALNIVVACFSFVAEVIALSLKQPEKKHPYIHTQIFAGCCFFACFLLMLLNREWLIRRNLNHRLNDTHQALNSLQKTAQGYMKVTEHQESSNEKGAAEEDVDILNERVFRYETLLRPTVLAFFIRMFYPIKV